MTGFKPGDRVQHHTGVEGTVTRAQGAFATVEWDAYVRANTHHIDLLTPLGEPMSTETIIISKTDLPIVGALHTGTADEAWRKAMIHLAVHEHLRAKEEKAEQEELEAEALTLCRVMWDNPDQQWAPMSPKAKTTWLGMARTAREMHNR